MTSNTSFIQHIYFSSIHELVVVSSNLLTMEMHLIDMTFYLYSMDRFLIAKLGCNWSGRSHGFISLP